MYVLSLGSEYSIFFPVAVTFAPPTTNLSFPEVSRRYISSESHIKAEIGVVEDLFIKNMASDFV